MQNDSRYIIGNLGEKAIHNYLKEFNIGERADWFNSQKDGHVRRNTTYEVKTLRLNHKTNGFWIQKNQWNKLDNVTGVYFIRIPEKSTDPCIAYLCANHNECWEGPYPWGKTYVRSYPLSSCFPIFTLSKKMSNDIIRHSKLISEHGRFNVEFRV